MTLFNNHFANCGATLMILLLLHSEMNRRWS